MTPTPPTKAAPDAGRLSFDIGLVNVVIVPAFAGQLARFLLYRTAPASSARMLIGSGSTQDTLSCIAQATSAARRAGMIG